MTPVALTVPGQGHLQDAVVQSMSSLPGAVMKHLLCIVALGSSLTHAYFDPPDFPAYTFGVTYSETLHLSLVAVSAGPVWMYYNYPGFDSMMPPPGVVTVEQMGRLAKYDVERIELDGGRAVISVPPGPYQYLSLDIVKQMSEAKQAVVVLKRWGEGAEKLEVREQIPQASLAALARLLSHGQKWVPPGSVSENMGVSAIIINASDKNKQLHRIKDHIRKRVSNAQDKTDEISLIFQKEG